jgi:hypothetical protein
MKQADDPRDLSLLAAHNGVLHPALPELAFPPRPAPAARPDSGARLT